MMRIHSAGSLFSNHVAHGLAVALYRLFGIGFSQRDQRFRQITGQHGVLHEWL
jgi:hypothetical protein